MPGYLDLTLERGEAGGERGGAERFEGGGTGAPVGWGGAGERDRDVGFQRDDLEEGADEVVFGVAIPLLEHALEGLVSGKQGDGGLRANTARAGDLVLAVAGERFEVGYLRGGDAETLDDLLRADAVRIG